MSATRKFMNIEVVLRVAGLVVDERRVVGLVVDERDIWLVLMGGPPGFMIHELDSFTMQGSRP
jgi:hypothetical protein